MVIENKKGDMLTPAQLVIWILAILGLVIALVIIFSLNLGGEADEKACSLSVLARGGAGASSFVPSATQSFVPLKCTTKKICITIGNAECSQFKGEKGVVNVPVPADNAIAAARIIEKTTVESMYNCWKLMGEGKLDIFPGKAPDGIVTDIALSEISSTAPTCFICDRISVSNALRDSKLKDGTPYYTEKILKEVNINKYAETNAPEGSTEPYIRLLTNNNLRAYPAGVGDTGVYDNTGIVFMQIVTKQGALDAAKMAAIKDVGVIFSLGKANPLTWLGTRMSIILNLGLVGLHTTSAATIQFSNQQTSAAYCGSLSGNKAEGNREGCSIAWRVNYDNVNEINNVCTYIEGNP